MKRKPLIDEAGEVRELTDDDFAFVCLLGEVRPPEFVNMVIAHQREMEKQGRIKVRGKQKLPTKEVVTLRLSPEILQAFRATGKGWQTRMNDVLLQYVHSEMKASL